MLEFFLIIIASLILLSKGAFTAKRLIVAAVLVLWIVFSYIPRLMMDTGMGRKGFFALLGWIFGSIAGYYYLALWHSRVPHAHGALTWPVVIIFLSIPLQFLLWEVIGMFVD